MDSSPIVIEISRKTFIVCPSLSQGLDQSWGEQSEELQNTRSKGPRKGTGRQLSCTWWSTPSKRISQLGVHCLLKDWDSISKIFTEEDLNPLGSMTKHVATDSQVWIWIGLFSHPAVHRVSMMQTSSSDYTSSAFCEMQGLFSRWSAPPFQKGQQSMNRPLQENKGSLMSSTNCFIQLKNTDTETESFGCLPSILTVDNSKDMVTFSMLYFACSFKAFWPWLILRCYWKKVLQFEH